MAQHVFISYASSDRDIAERLCRYIEAAGIACWIAPRDVCPGADWAAEIIQAIDRADIMLLVLSECSNNSIQVHREVERAGHRRKALMPIQTGDVSLTRNLEYFLSNRHWLDARNVAIESKGDAIVRAITSLRESSESPPVRLSKPAPSRHVRSPRVKWSPATLSRVQVLLAECVGPVAPVLVERASASAPHRDAFVATLAAAVSDPEIRAEFVAACRRALR